MKKVKITVLKTTFDKELADEYGAEGLGPCPDVYKRQTKKCVDTTKITANFCRALEIYKYIMPPEHGKNFLTKGVSVYYNASS